MSLSIADIEEDISEFQSRIANARKKLAALPTGRLPYKKHKARERQQRQCKTEIEHCLQLIKYAEQGIQLRQAGVLWKF